LKRSFEIKITAEEARRQVNRWLRDEVSMLISADLPILVVGQQVVWRATAWISFPHTGRAGQVGVIDVDVTTGAMNNTPECKADIERQAEAVAARQPPYRPKDKVPEQYLAQNVPPAPKLRILEDGTLTPATPANKEHP
jgi:hypothetical protein